MALVQIAACTLSLSFYSVLAWQVYEHVGSFKSSPQPLNPLVFMSVYFTCALQCKYGLMIGDGSIVLANAVGMLVSACGLFAVYFVVGNGNNNNIAILTRAHMERQMFKFLGAFTVFGFAVYEGWIGEAGVGRTASIVSVAVYIVPVWSVITRLRSRDLARYPQLFEPETRSLSNDCLLAVNTLASVTWAVYGMHLGDPWIALPNAFGFLCCLCQVFFMYFRSKRFDLFKLYNLK